MHSFARGWVAVGLIVLVGCGELKRREEDLGAGRAAVGGSGGARAGSAAGGGGGAAGASAGGSAAGAGSSGSAAGAGSSGSAAGASAGASAGADTDGGVGADPARSPVATRFVIENMGTAPVLLGSDCYGRWLLLAEGDQPLRYDDHCLCECGGTMTCTCPGACPSLQEVLMPGLTSEQAWDGVGRVVQPSECFEPHVPAIGAELSATACWNGVLGGMGNPNCRITQFAYGESEVVQLSAVGESASLHRVSLVLINETGVPIEILTHRCEQQGWFKLDMGEASSVTTFCPCTCDAEQNATSCPVCGGCREDEWKTLAPGEGETLAWDGRFHYTYDSTCTAEYTYPYNTQVKSQLCWRTRGQTTETCGSVSFVLESAEQTVSFSAR
ncbi:MAG: hypothetical protein ABW321_36165 [Polyangiales bacterium]